MSQQQTVTINGMRYDALSGMPIDEIKPIEVSVPARPQASHAKKVHTTSQRSQTLNRAFVKNTTPVRVVNEVRKPIATRSPHITKFAKDPQPIIRKKRVMSDIGPTKHHAVEKAHVMTKHATVSDSTPQPRSAQEIKHKAISEALANSQPTDTKQHRATRQHGKMLNVASASLAILLLAGYFTYINMPNLSVRVAAAQAGINATYPGDRPAGYSLKGPVAYQNGQVSMKFAANVGPQEFALNQTQSSWDSSALLSNYIEPQSKGNFATYNDAGLTIYTYGNAAAWVNGGILYTVEGNATLSNDQVRGIATSM